MEPLINRNLCTRCGACFAADRRGLLQKDGEGFPIHSCADTAYIQELLDVCSGENWNYRELLDSVYGQDYPFAPDSPDKGQILRLGIAFSNKERFVEDGQSGGVSTSIFAAALETGLIESAGMVRRPRAHSELSPFSSEPFVARTIDEVLEGAGSKYTICSTLEIVPQLEATEKSYALSLLPCQTVGYQRLKVAKEIGGNCRFVIGPFCGFNMEAQMGKDLFEALGEEPSDVSSFANRAGAFPGVTTFERKDGEKVLLDRTAHRALYRMYSPTRCFTCTDFSNELADLSIADCWNPKKEGGFEYPRGAAWVLIRTERGEEALQNAVNTGWLKYKEMPLDANDKHWRESLLHRKVRTYHRIEHFRERGIAVPKFDYPEPELSEELKAANSSDLFFINLFKNDFCRKRFLKWWVGLHRESIGETRRRIAVYLGLFVFTHRVETHSPAKALRNVLVICARSVASKLGLGRAARLARAVAKIPRRILLPPKQLRDRDLSTNDAMAEQFRSWGFYNEKRSGAPRILLAAGHGYGNVGDEAQCGAAVARWKKYAPGCKITLFSPNPAYTEVLHQEEVEWAPRVTWFCSNTNGTLYNDGHPLFYRHFKKLKWRLILTVHLMKRGIPLLVCKPREARVLQVLLDHDILHISGGGFLTGKTRSRLWENCLLMRVCQILGIPYILTGHNIGVFQDDRDRKLAQWGLKGAAYVGLRDKGISEEELAAIGIEGEHVESTCDDALLCPRMDLGEVREVLERAGADPDKPWVAVNYHFWGQSEEEKPAHAKRFAELCDYLAKDKGLQPVFIAMTPTDVEAEELVAKEMCQTATLIPYSPDYKVVRGVIADSELCFTMKHHPIVFAQGESVPVVSIALDDYYYHKNKGALDNTGHGQCMVDRECFYSIKCEECISEVIENQKMIKAESSSWTQNMREIESVPYEKAIQILSI